MHRYTTIIFVFLLLLSACQNPENQEETANDQESVSQDPINPPAEGFNLEASDEKAIEIADAVMEASGGRKNWDNTRLLVWNFFGARKLYWDKKTQDVRIDFLKTDMQILMNIDEMKGRVKKDGNEFTEADSLKKYLEMGKSIWINDSYWLVMPFKLKDTGVTLKYLKEDTTQDGRKADVLGLTFDNVGNTPDNKYDIYVDQESKLVSQWSYYREAKQDSANFTLPWLDYKTFGNIQLSGNRDARQITEIQVLDSIPGALFEDFEKPTDF